MLDCNKIYGKRGGGGGFFDGTSFIGTVVNFPDSGGAVGGSRESSLPGRLLLGRLRTFWFVERYWWIELTRWLSGGRLCSGRWNFSDHLQENTNSSKPVRAILRSCMTSMYFYEVNCQPFFRLFKKAKFSKIFTRSLTRIDFSFGLATQHTTSLSCQQGESVPVAAWLHTYFSGTSQTSVILE